MARELWIVGVWRCELLPGGILRLFQWDRLAREAHPVDETDAVATAERWRREIAGGVAPVTLEQQTDVVTWQYRGWRCERSAAGPGLARLVVFDKDERAMQTMTADGDVETTVAEFRKLVDRVRARRVRHIIQALQCQ